MDINELKQWLIDMIETDNSLLETINGGAAIACLPDRIDWKARLEARIQVMQMTIDQIDK